MEVQTLIDDAVAEASALVEGAKAADRPLTAEESEQLGALEAHAKGLHDKMTAAHMASELVREQQKVDADRLASLKGLNPIDVTKTGHEDEAGTRVPDRQASGAKTLGEMFIGSKSMQASVGKGLDDAMVRNGAYRSDEGIGLKAVLTSPTHSSNASVMAMDNPRPHRFLDMITVLPSSADTIISHRYTIANAATAVAEGAAKPEGALTLATVTLTPTKVATWIPTTTEALSDFPRMQAVINTQLVGDVAIELEGIIAAAMAAWTGIATQAYSNSVVETILKAKTKANTYTQADGVILADSDYEALALTAGTANDHYISPGPFGPANFTLWGLPVYPSPSVAAGFAYVGRMSSLIWNEVWPMRTKTGWINTDFTENQVTILAETRGMFDVSNNLHLVKADLTV